MLQDLAARLENAPAQRIDPEADAFIRRYVGARPDALYLLTQTVLIQNMALERAEQELMELRGQPGGGLGSFLGGGQGLSRQQRGSGPGGGFLSRLFGGGGGGSSWQQAGGGPASGAGTFLRTAAGTAAGVAAGTLAFEGLRSLFGGGLFGHSQDQVDRMGMLDAAPLSEGSQDSAFAGLSEIAPDENSLGFDDTGDFGGGDDFV